MHGEDWIGAVAARRPALDAALRVSLLQQAAASADPLGYLGGVEAELTGLLAPSLPGLLDQEARRARLELRAALARVLPEVRSQFEAPAAPE